MKKINSLTVAIFAFTFFLFLGGCENKAQKPMTAKQIPLEDFFKNPEQTRYQISPDGKYFSFLAPFEKRMNIFVQERGQQKATRLTSETDRDIARYFWPNNNQILYLKDDGGDENHKLYGVNIDGSNPICFTDFEDVKTQIIDDLEECISEKCAGFLYK